MTDAAWTCASNLAWSTTVEGSGGDEYRVSWDPVDGWRCTCKGYRFTGRCYHIADNMVGRCGWNERLDPAAAPLQTSGGKLSCPRCWGPVEAVEADDGRTR